MLNELLTLSELTKLDTQQQAVHSQTINEMIEYLKHSASQTLSEKIDPKKLIELLEDSKVSTFNPFTHYFIDQVDSIFTISELLDETTPSEDHEAPSDEEEELFEFWQKTEHTYEMFELMNMGKNLIDISECFLGRMISQLFSYYEEKILGEKSKDYTPIKEMGDTFKHCQTLETTDLSVFFHFDDEEIGKIKNNEIVKALQIIKKYSPLSYVSFRNFTHTLIAVNEPGVVSYSSQQLPGYSSINMYERDFIDLIDDLIHENGHHHLNAYLNCYELIDNTDNDKIFYSPWRRALRPIRGIYHAYFTFFMGLNLFADLFANSENLDLDSSQKAKIKERFMEEYLMLKFTEVDLKIAFDQERITPTGFTFIEKLFEEFKRYTPFFDKISEVPENIKELSNHLIEMRKTYNIEV